MRGPVKKAGSQRSMTDSSEPTTSHHPLLPQVKTKPGELEGGGGAKAQWGKNERKQRALHPVCVLELGELQSKNLLLLLWELIPPEGLMDLVKQSCLSRTPESPLL